MPVKSMSVSFGFQAILELPAMNVLTHWPILLQYNNITISQKSQPIIISILFTSFYLAVGNPSGLISQLINFVQLNHPSLLGHKNRQWETALARLRIGHTNLTQSYLMTQSPPTLCMTCNSLLSVPHILLFCPCYTAAQATAFPHLTHLS